MIYDGHAYCIQDQNGDGGFEHRNEFQRLLQFQMAHHFQPAVRTRDRALANSDAMADFSRPFDVTAVKEAGFRALRHGRYEWQSEGEAHFKQVMPPMITDMLYNAEMLVAEMDYAGVDMGLLHRTPYLGISNDFIADCCHQYPQRLQGLAYVREWLVGDDPDTAIGELQRSINELGLHGLQFLPSFSLLYGVNEDWDSGGYRPFWDAVAALNIPVFITLVTHQVKTVDGFLDQLRVLRRFVERYPDVTVVLTHGLDWLRFVADGKLSVPGEVYDIAPCDCPNFHVQILFAVFLGLTFDYPMLQIKPTLAQMAKRLGTERILWGTDVPIVMRYTTYRQSLDQIRLYCQDELGNDGMEQVLGGNMARMMGVENVCGRGSAT